MVVLFLENGMIKQNLRFLELMSVYFDLEFRAADNLVKVLFLYASVQIRIPLPDPTRRVNIMRNPLFRGRTFLHGGCWGWYSKNLLKNATNCTGLTMWCCRTRTGSTEHVEVASLALFREWIPLIISANMTTQHCSRRVQNCRRREMSES